MKHLGHTLVNYAQLSRLSNLPTCITNVLVGVAIGSAGDPFPWPLFTIIALAVSLFYIAGMALNDLVDAEQDRLERPDRPIPSGKITKRAARNFVLFSFSAGLTLLVIRFPGTTFLTALLLAAIVLYDLTHKKWAGSVVLMGACRGLVYLVGAHAVAGNTMNSIIWHNAVLLASIITFYTMSITIVAKGENKNSIDGRRWLSVAMPLVVCLSVLFIKPTLESGSREFYETLYSPLPFLLLWMGIACWFIFQKPTQVKKTILIWLSGICLVDANFLSLLNYTWISFIAIGCCIITVIGYLRIKGT